MVDYPYETNYNDHFETPVEAYEDVSLVLEFIARKNRKQTPSSSDKKKKDAATNWKDDLTLYDPFFCSGRTKTLLHQKLGFKQVIHEKRDFYQDIAEDKVPRDYNVLVTNPPYSEEHKQKCLHFCLSSSSLSNSNCNRPFCLLMPNYVASRQYYRGMMGVENSNQREQQHDNKDEHQEEKSASCPYHLLYLVPSLSYQYDHPQGTGHDTSPFESLWFCGLPKTQFSEPEIQAWIQQHSSSRCLITTSWSELIKQQGLTLKRANPRQRRKKAARSAGATTFTNNNNDDDDAPTPKKRSAQHLSSSGISQENPNNKGNKKQKQKKSKYRDEKGRRSKKRF